MVLGEKCLLRNLGNPELCEPTNAAYIAMHGHSGKGGRVAAARIPEDYIGILVPNLVTNKTDPTLHKTIEQYVASLDKQFPDVRDELLKQGQSSNQVRVKSLYLWSESPGTGKTTVACAILQEYLLRNFLGHISRRQTPPLKPVFFLDVNEWQTEYNAFNRKHISEDIAKEHAERYYQAMDYAKKAEFAVLDDIGVRAATEGFRGDLHSVINYRVTNELPTVYTSNIPIDGLTSVFGESRMTDRIRHMTRELHFAGTTKRGIQK